MDTLLMLALNNALAATVLAFLVAGLSWLCQRPALAHRLWLLVLLKLLTPPLWLVAIPWPLWTETRPTTADTTGPAVVLLEALEPVPEAESHRTPAPMPLAAALGDPAVPTAAVSSIPTWQMALAALWLLGSLFWLATAALRVGRFRRLLRYTQPAPPVVQEQARRLARYLGLARCPSVYLVAATISPLLWALGRTPRLLVPAALWAGLTEAQRDTLLVHELAHLRRRDHWVRGLELVVMAVYWWHPVVWWARHELREAEEQCCDAWVVWTLPDAAPAYATALLATVAFLSQTRPALPAAASGIGHINVLKRRLTMILQGTTARALTWGGLLVVLGLGVVLLPLVPSLGQLSAQAPAPFFVELVASDDAGLPAAELQGADKPAAAARRVAQERERAEMIEHARDEVELQQVQLEVRQALLQAARTGLAQATERMLRLERLHQQGTISPEALERARDDVTSLEAEFKIKLAELREPELRVRQARRHLERLERTVWTVKPEEPKADPRAQSRPTTKPQSRPPVEVKPTDENARLHELELQLERLLQEMESLRRELRSQRPAELKK